MLGALTDVAVAETVVMICKYISKYVGELYVFLFRRLLLSLCVVVGVDYSVHVCSSCTPPLTYTPSSTSCI